MHESWLSQVPLLATAFLKFRYEASTVAPGAADQEAVVETATFWVHAIQTHCEFEYLRATFFLMSMKHAATRTLNSNWESTRTSLLYAKAT